MSLSDFEKDLQLQQYFGQEEEEDIVYIGEKGKNFIYFL
jgi:hypothetical protein